MEQLIDETSGMDLSDSPTAQKYAEKFDEEQAEQGNNTGSPANAAEGKAEQKQASEGGDTKEDGISTDTPPQTEGEDVPESSKIDEISTQLGIPKEEFISSVLKEAKIPIKVKGKHMEVTYDEMVELTQKGAAFDQKNRKLSEVAKKGEVINLIEKGDKAAMKKVLELMRDSAQSDDFDDLVSILEDVDGNIDEKAIEEEYEKNTLFEEAFGDVKKDVDFEKNLNTINTEMRDFIPNEIFQTVLSKPEDFRTMYNIVATGLWEDTMPVFNAKLNALPASVRTQVESNFDMYMDMYGDVLRKSRLLDSNQIEDTQTLTESNQTDPATSSEASTEDVLASITSGTRSAGGNSSAKKVKNAMELSTDDFKKMKERFINGEIAFTT